MSTESGTASSWTNSDIATMQRASALRTDSSAAAEKSSARHTKLNMHRYPLKVSMISLKWNGLFFC